MYIIANPQLWTSHDNKLGLDEEKCKAFNFILDVYMQNVQRQDVSHHNELFVQVKFLYYYRFDTKPY